MYRVLGFCILALTFVTPAHAQMLGAEPLSITVNPEYPQPYQTITITPASNLIDLAASTITITVNGKVLSKGSGQPATYTVGGAGETDTITVTAVTAGGTYSAKAVVRPAGVALVTEPQSSTHPFYEGGALIAAEGRIRLIAVPDFRTSAGKSIDPASLVYSWKADDRILTNASGIGKSVLTADAPVRYRDTNVSVTVSTQDSGMAAQAVVSIEPIDPYIVFYHDGPLTGPEFDTALGSLYSMKSDEDTFRAVPYFFAKTPLLAWTVDGNQNGTEPVITVRTTGTGAGTSVLSLEATQADSYQNAEASFSVGYGGGEKKFNIFGL